ncbi:type ISP restriction/modification enzyme [Mycobacteroides abscessus]|uniref:type ISP restriction/modification enzyme n=1 Tax=Mycobacteroides abscessus TaxID=36809 RepID=UPI0010569654|nr:type ISP restriction/modification enzyme [Mycobacteroides abscessus]
MSQIQAQFKSGVATELSYRPALAQLMRAFDDVEASNDPKHSEHGAPDFVFKRVSNPDLTLGYAETKNVGTNLDKVMKTDQMRRYAGYQNLFLTDNLEFRFLKDGEVQTTIRIGDVAGGMIVPDVDRYEDFLSEVNAFLRQPPQAITSGKRLAEIMGAKSRRVRDDILTILKTNTDPKADVAAMLRLMRETLVHDLDNARFADMYAQTLIYGLFVGRYNDDTPATFDRHEARRLVPKTNPFLLHFFDYIVGPSFDEHLARAVDELCAVFRVSDVKTIVHKHLNSGGEHADPIIHFYEDFLKAYDPDIRKKMGAYYTPIPVVQFMVKHVDSLLKSDFKKAKGLADTEKVERNHRLYLTDLKTGKQSKRYKDEKRSYHRVQILDPAVGTATFLNETIKYLFSGFKGQEGQWPSYVTNHLLPRLNGFELMMAPYTIAHLKLGMTLDETKAGALDKRLGVYLTNTLEEGIPHAPDLFSVPLTEAITDESQIASSIKSERPIMIVIGNPPWSGESSNKTPYADSLLDKYRVEPGGQSKLDEQNSKWITDDYVKFIAFAEDMISRNGEGIMAMITNHGYLNNPTFRGMRWRLTKTFDRIEVLDLHGNSTKREVTPDGSADENVFDIRAGVSIIFAVKYKKGSSAPATVSFAELWGTRASKFKALAKEIEFEDLELNKKSYLFSPSDRTGEVDYEAGVGLTELFLVYATGVVTKNDSIAVDLEEEDLWTRMQDLGTLDAAALREKYSIKPDSRDWVLDKAIDDAKDHQSSDYIIDFAYRPFDTRKLFFTGNPKGVVAYTQMKVMAHMTRGSNMAIVSGRQGQAVGMMPWNLAFVTDQVSDLNMFYRGGGTVFPVLQNHEDGSTTSNLEPTARKKLVGKIGEIDDLQILDYVYGVLHSPTYREKFKAFLRSDFARIPVPTDRVEFDRVADFGGKLRGLHLLTDPDLVDYATLFPEYGTGEVDRHQLDGTKVWINDKQYFEGVPESVWDFYIGGYQPAQKWLKDRKGQTLSSDDIDRYQQILEAIRRTDELMKDFEDVPPSWA